MRSPLVAVLPISVAIGLAVASFVPAARADGEVHIQAIIAKKTDPKCTTALGFVVEGGANRDEARKRAEDKARAQFPASRSFHFANNYKKEKYLGRHVVVLSAGTGNAECPGKVMGVGFGNDEKEASKDAKRLLGKMFPFNDGNLKTELSKSY